MNLEDIIRQFTQSAQVKQIGALLQSDTKTFSLRGLTGSQDAFVACTVCRQSALNHFFILSDHEVAAYFYNDLKNLMPDRTPLFFPDSFKRPQYFNELNSHNILLRTETISRLNNPSSTGEIVISYPEALLEKVVTQESLVEETLQLQTGEKTDVDLMIELLVSYEFERVDFVYEPGQFSIRGDIIDIFSFAHEYPYRIELFGEDVESIRSFDPVTQLSVQKMSRIIIVPNIQSHFTNDKKTSVLEILPSNTVVWIEDGQLLVDTLTLSIEKAIKAQLEIKKHPLDYPRHPLLEDKVENEFLSASAFLKGVAPFRVIEFGGRSLFPTTEIVSFQGKPQPSFNKNFPLLISHLNDNTDRGFTNLIWAENPKQIERFNAIFTDLKAEVQWQSIPLGIHEGFSDEDLKLACYTDHQIFNRYHKYNLRQGFSSDKAMLVKTLRELKPGDYVTHIDHGVGVFSGLEKIVQQTPKGEVEQECVRLIYAGNDILYVGIQSLHKISKYVGKEGESPRVNKLGSDTWSNLKRKTKKKIKELAFDLIQLYAKRKAAKGFAFSADSYMQNELEASFMFEDTPDQAKATEDVKRDMQSPSPMDRLICGDVGFGKTEVAIRAAFKAACDGKQVAVLAPTTILVMQHYQTFKERLADFPVEIDFLNRFKTGKEKKETLARLKEGKTNIIIGTHALVGKAVVFKDLGLLIVDEEQKFGVGTKETLKNLRAHIDSLTLTATPIPRTLSFSMMGARDLSIINTPPPNRQPITTEVCPLDPDLIREAIEYETARGGQVFFVHNRVRDIGEVKEMIQKIAPNVDIGVAHGQMHHRTHHGGTETKEINELEEVILKFVRHEYDVLLSTNIIESGIDIPNANTIILNNAHQFGLSDLHQLRGRVGRSNKHAFCYLLSPPMSTLSNESRQRLKTIEEFSELGSGFNIAMRDLDIRGAGNMLGGEQSGFIAEIGYDVYQKILDEAVRELKESDFKDLYREEVERTRDYVRDCAIETDLEMLIPNEYVSSTTERMMLYRQLNDIKDETGLKAFEEHLHDRFGKAPEPVYELIDAMRMKWLATQLGMEQIILKGKSMRCYFVANKDSTFYTSAVFGKILQYVQQGLVGISLRETEKYLVLTFEEVKNMKEAEQRLQDLNGYVTEPVSVL